MRPVTIAAVVLTLMDAATAADSAPAPADAALARSQYLKAVEQAAEIGASRWAFTLAYKDETDAEAKTYRLRFDPRAPAGERWTVSDPAAGQLTKDEKKELKRLSRNDDADDALIYDGLAERVDKAELIALSDAEAVFAIPVHDLRLPEKARAAIVATAHFDRKAGIVSSIEVEARESFKPAAIARIDKMRQVQRFAPVGPNGEALLVSSVSDTAGEAMLKSFSSKSQIAYSDFEKVDAPPRAPRKK
jgi:hypothetical protein